MNDILDAVSARIKAPYFGYALLAFIAMNWRGIFLLTVTEGLPQDRLNAFDAETSFVSLILLPLLVGAVVAASAPWIRLAFEVISRMPFELIDNLHLESEHKKTIKKTQLERSRSYFFAEKEEELIERAKRDKEVLDIEDDQLKERLMLEIEALRRERDRMSESLSNQEDRIQLSAVETDMLKAAAKSGHGTISRNEYIGERTIQIGTLTFGQDSPREFSKYESALKSLLSKGLVQAIGHKGELFELTNSGWQLADAL